MRAISLIGGFASVLVGLLAPVAAAAATTCNTNCQSFCMGRPSASCLAACEAEKLASCGNAQQNSQSPNFNWSGGGDSQETYTPWHGPQPQPSIIPYSQNGQLWQEHEYTGYTPPPPWGRWIPNASHDLEHGPGSSNDLVGSEGWVARTLDDAKEKSDRSKLHIADTAYAPLFGLGEETDGYGLYTYLLFRQRTERERLFLKDLQNLPVASGLKSIPRGEIDLLLVPSQNCKAAPSSMVGSDCAKDILRNIADDLNKYYDYSAAELLLDEICGNGTPPPDKIAFFCKHRYGDGPFLFTYAKPVSKLHQIPPPFLFFDFSTIDESAFNDYLAAYEDVVKSDDYTDDSRLNGLRLRILNVIDEARSVAGPTVEAATILVHIIYQPEDKNENKKIE
jgi:hypothetical protein